MCLRALRLPSCLRLRALGAVLRSSLLAAGDAHCVERAADHVVANAREVLDAAAADQHQRVLLQVVADPGNVSRHLDAIGEPDARHLAERRVRLLRRLGEHAHADAALLRADLERRTLRLGDDLVASLANELTDSRHKGVGSHFFEDTPCMERSGVSSKNDSRPHGSGVQAEKLRPPLDTPDPAASLTAGNVASGLKSAAPEGGDAASGA